METLKCVMRDSNFLSRVDYYLNVARPTDIVDIVRNDTAEDLARMYGMYAVTVYNGIVLVPGESFDYCIAVQRNHAEDAEYSIAMYSGSGVVYITKTPENIKNAIERLAGSSEDPDYREQEESSALQFYANRVH